MRASSLLRRSTVPAVLLGLLASLLLAAPAQARALRLPSAPTHLSAKAGVLSASLSWSTPTAGRPVDRYRVARASSAKGPWTVLTSSVTSRSYVARGLAAKPYYFRVSAHNKRGWGTWSASVRVVPRSATPGAVTNLNESRVQVPPTDVDPPSWHVTVSWTPPSWSGSSAINAYRVDSSTSPQGPWINPTTTTQLSYGVDLPIEQNYRIYYRVTAHNSHGYGVPKVGFIPGVPGPVTALHGPPGNTSVALSWSAPANNGGSAISGYTVTWQQIDVNGNPVGQLNSVNTAVGSPQYTITGLTNGAIYQIGVAADNAIGVGGAVTFGAIPGVPYGSTISSVSATRTSVSTVDVAVAWTAATSNGGGPALAGYDVQIFDETSSSSTPVASFTASSSTTGHTFTGLALTAGTPYVAVVQPFNANNSAAGSPGYADFKEFAGP